MLSDIYASIRDTWPPSRVVAILVPIVLPFIAIVNGWLADHLPFIAEQVGPDQIIAIVIATIASGVALAYKWLDGRAKWEAQQVQARVELSYGDDADEKQEALEDKGILEPPPEKRREERRRRRLEYARA